MAHYGRIAMRVTAKACPSLEFLPEYFDDIRQQIQGYAAKDTFGEEVPAYCVILELALEDLIAQEKAV